MGGNGNSSRPSSRTTRSSKKRTRTNSSENATTTTTSNAADTSTSVNDDDAPSNVATEHQGGSKGKRAKTSHNSANDSEADPIAEMDAEAIAQAWRGALIKNDVPTARMLLDADKVDVANPVAIFDLTKILPLWSACRNGQFEMARLLTNDHCADVHASSLSMTTVQVAARFGRTQCLSLLLEHGALPDAKATGTSLSPLHLAASGVHLSNSPECLRLLLEGGANVDVSDLRGDTPLMTAALCGHSLCVQLLLDAGANVALCCTDCNAFVRVIQAGHAECARLLVDAGTEVDLGAMVLNMPMVLWAACRNDMDCVDLLVEKGAVIEAGMDFRDPLCRAARNGALDGLKFLVQKATDLRVPLDFDSGLREALKRGRSECVRYLVGKGAAVNGPPANDEDRCPPLLLAGSAECMRVLLELGANKDITWQGRPGLVHAAFRGELELMAVFLDAGVAVEPIIDGDNRLKSALEVAALHGHLKCVRYLHEKHNAELRHALIFSILGPGDNVETVRYLLSLPTPNLVEGELDNYDEDKVMDMYLYSPRTCILLASVGFPLPPPYPPVLERPDLEWMHILPTERRAVAAWEMDEEPREIFAEEEEQRKFSDLLKRVTPLMPENMVPTAVLTSLAYDLAAFVTRVDHASVGHNIAFRLQDLESWKEWKSRCGTVQETVDHICCLARGSRRGGVGGNEDEDERESRDQMATATAARDAHIPTLRDDISRHIDDLVKLVDGLNDPFLDVSTIEALEHKYDEEVVPLYRRANDACEGLVDAHAAENAVMAVNANLEDQIPGVAQDEEGPLGEFRAKWQLLETCIRAWTRSASDCGMINKAAIVVCTSNFSLIHHFGGCMKNRGRDVVAARRAALEVLPAALHAYRRVMRKQATHMLACFRAARHELEKIRRVKGALAECRQELKRLDRIVAGSIGLGAAIATYHRLRAPIEDAEIECMMENTKVEALQSRRRNPDRTMATQLRAQVASLKADPAYMDVCAQLRERSIVLPEVDALAPEINPLHGTNARMLPSYLLDRDFQDVTVLGGDDQIGARHQILKAQLKSAVGDGGADGFCVLKRFPEEGRARLRRTAHIIAGLNHPNIIRVMGVVRGEGNNAWYLMLPYHEKGDLRGWIDNPPLGEAPVDGCDDNRVRPTNAAAKRTHGKRISRAMRLLRGVLLGLDVLHTSNVLHRDLKPGNVLIADDGTPVICDFETSKESASAITNTMTMVGRVVGTHNYIDHEVFRGLAQYSIQSDIYSFGVMMSEMLCGTRVTAPDQIDSVSDDDIPPTAKALLRQLLQPTAALRGGYTASSLLHAPFFRGAATQRECIICYETFQLVNGIECHNEASPHFLCAGCFSKHVDFEAQRPLNELQRPAGRVYCPNWRMGGPGACHCHPFLHSEICTLVDAAVFEKYKQAHDRITESNFATAMEARLTEEKERLGRLDVVARAADMARTHIVEDILTLKCPRCRAAFVDFDGCMAISCGRCPARFCGWCLADCGDDDSHPHVRRCADVPGGYEPIFPEGGFETFEMHHRGKKILALRQYLDGHGAEVAARVVDGLRVQLEADELGEIVLRYCEVER